MDPAENVVRPGPELRVSASVCLNSALYPGWGVKFKLDGGLARTVTSPPYETVYAGVAPGDHSVEAFIVNSSGAEVSGSRKYDSVSSFGVGDYFVAIGDSITAGSRDTDLSDNASEDGRNNEGGFTPILNDLLTQAKGYPHTVEMEGISGYTSAQGLARLPLVLERHPFAEFFLILYGTNDASGMFPVPSGLGLSPGNTGYPGSFKDNLQQIINMINLDNRNAFLSKAPYTRSSAFNASIQKYNQVITNLADNNGITVTPPDFYTFFEANPGQLSDTVHPTSVGYRSMATMWFNVLQ